MPTLDNMADLAKLCAFNARETLDPRAAEELWRMALEYQARAAKFDSGVKPDIGPPPDSRPKPR